MLNPASNGYTGIITNRLLVFPISQTVLMNHTFTLSDIYYVGVTAVTQLTATAVGQSSNALHVTVSEDLSSYIGYQAVLILTS